LGRGNSRNGLEARFRRTEGGKLHVEVPTDRHRVLPANPGPKGTAGDSMDVDRLMISLDARWHDRRDIAPDRGAGRGPRRQAAARCEHDRGDALAGSDEACATAAGVQSLPVPLLPSHTRLVGAVGGRLHREWSIAPAKASLDDRAQPSQLCLGDRPADFGGIANFCEAYKSSPSKATATATYLLWAC
jgi:hypothetical protein